MTSEGLQIVANSYSPNGPGCIARLNRNLVYWLEAAEKRVILAYQTNLMREGPHCVQRKSWWAFASSGSMTIRTNYLTGSSSIVV